MPLPLVEITRRVEFSAAHRLRNPDFSEAENRRLYGPCYEHHGHNYALEVTVCGPVPGETGMVMDLNRLAMLLDEEVVSIVDHKHLNHDVPFLEGLIPTAEVVAVALWERLQPRIEEFEGCRLDRIRLFESRENFVDYRGPTT
ncbi:MAG: 6-carboxytetrahydropterin synthase [Planctomycetota bacterium]|jgi:6-pyruvoyltetrahydropterin/6-carboxytetrahydropterin synthase|nr:6-carboxytetrahydropterin synthase [Planctomycetota bacterium]